MRKRFRLAFAAAALAVAFGSARTGLAADDDQAFFDKQISKLVKVTPRSLASAAVDKIFTARFYNVQLAMADGNTDAVVTARSGDDLALVQIPNTTQEMPDLVKLIKADFHLKTDADAKAFQDALDTIYPIDTTFNKDDLAARAFRHTGNTWSFIRGKFFDHFKGFVITTDSDGKITAIKWSLDDIK